MDVLVRRDRSTVVRHRLTAAGVARILTAMKKSKLDLGLPRFTVTSALDLVPELSRLGVRAALTPGVADLGDMSPRPGRRRARCHGPSEGVREGRRDRHGGRRGQGRRRRSHLCAAARHGQLAVHLRDPRPAERRGAFHRRVMDPKR
jgi:Serpin (serine protease inhibitor)